MEFSRKKNVIISNMKKPKYYMKNTNSTKKIIKVFKQLTQRKKIMKNVYMKVSLKWKFKEFVHKLFTNWKNVFMLFSV